MKQTAPNVYVNVDTGAYVRVDVVRCLPGETVTVYLGALNDEASQVELRVLPDGTRQVFLDQGPQLSVKSFDLWTSGDEAVERGEVEGEPCK